MNLQEVSWDKKRGPRVWRPEAQARYCYTCGRRRHLKRTCPYWEEKKPSPKGGKAGKPQCVQPVKKTGMGDACFTCGEPGHMRRQCPHRQNGSPGKGRVPVGNKIRDKPGERPRVPKGSSCTFGQFWNYFFKVFESWNLLKCLSWNVSVSTNQHFLTKNHFVEKFPTSFTISSVWGRGSQTAS